MVGNLPCTGLDGLSADTLGSMAKILMRIDKKVNI